MWKRKDIKENFDCRLLRKTIKFFQDRKTPEADKKAKEYLKKLENSDCRVREAMRLDKKDMVDPNDLPDNLKEK